MAFPAPPRPVEMNSRPREPDLISDIVSVRLPLCSLFAVVVVIDEIASKIAVGGRDYCSFDLRL
jgi:hypothetical protein